MKVPLNEIIRINKLKTSWLIPVSWTHFYNKDEYDIENIFTQAST